MAGVALPAAPHLQTVRIVSSADGPTTVVMEGDGPLPTPTVGVVEEGSPRIFFDFSGVLPETQGAPGENDPWIRRVRVAIHSQDPLVTRVVIDLVARPTPYEVRPDPSAPNAFQVQIGRPGPRPQRPQRAPLVTPSRPAPAAPPPSAAPPPPKEPTRRTETSGRAASARAYLQQVTPLVARLDKLRPVLVAIDTQTEQNAVSLQSAAQELGTIAEELTELRAPGPLSAAHDQLLQSCSLALQAVKGRMEFTTAGNTAIAWNAASAAAGALMLMDRARATLGVAPAEAKGAG